MRIVTQLYFLIIATVFTLHAEISTNWISYSKSSINQYGVYLFRKSYQFDSVPQTLLLKISADNKYILYINGNKICSGPAKGDLKTYKYDIVDIANALVKGKNTFAVQVYNGGTDKPLAFVTKQTALLIQSMNTKYPVVTDKSWKTFKNKAYKPIDYNKLLQPPWFYGFYASGSGDFVNLKKHPENWEKPDFNDNNWNNACLLDSVTCSGWNLFASPIPFMDQKIIYPVKIREIQNGITEKNESESVSTIKIPAHSKATILYDFENMTFGYPKLTVKNGSGSTIKIKYAESLYDSINYKAHRDSVKGKQMYGVWDIFKPTGRNISTFTPLWVRTFRYLKLEIKTKSEALLVEKPENNYMGYPYPNTSTFTCNNEQLNSIFKMSLNTFKLCSSDTYFDTPYYEQLCYGGDNVPIGAISLYNSTDDRLLKEMLRIYPQSVNPATGLFKSAYPSRFDFDMGTWSLAWIQSLNEYYKFRNDSVFVSQFSEKINLILNYFEKHLNKSTAVLEHIKTKNFIDWSEKSGSIPHKNSKNEYHQSVLLTLYYLYTIDNAVELFSNIGEKESATKWKNLSKEIKSDIYTKYYDTNYGLIREYPEKDEFTQHTNILAILCNVMPVEKQSSVLNTILTFNDFDERVSSYFSYFLFKSMEKTNRESLILDNMGFWNTFISKGLRTCGESGFASMDRSDCHAWSAHPAYFFINSICGIKPADIGFRTAVIEPHLGNLTQVNASMPHPQGNIIVEYSVENKMLHANIQLPENLNGIWKYNGNEIKLHSGQNIINTSVLF